MTCLRGSSLGSHDRRIIASEHILGTTLHIVAVLLVYRLAGFFPALIFAVHPHALQTSVWLNGKRYIVGTIIALTAMNFPAIGGIGLFTAAWQPSTIGAGLYGAIHGSWWSIAVVIVAAVWMKIPQKVLKRIKSRDREIPASVIAPWTRIILSVKLYGAYFWRSILPTRPAMFYPELGQFDMSEHDADKAVEINVHFFEGIVAVATSAWFITLNPLFAVFPLSIAPYLHIMPRNIVQLNADRYAYCASIGIFAVIGSSPIISVILASWYTVMTFYGSRQYKNMDEFTRYNFEMYPNCQRAAYFHALKQWEREDEKGSLATTLEGLHHNWHSYDLNIMAAVLYRNAGDIQKSKEHAWTALNNMYTGQERKQVNQCDMFLRS